MKLRNVKTMVSFNLEKDQEALAVYLEEIHDKTIYFDSEIERLHYLVDNNFYFNV